MHEPIPTIYADEMEVGDVYRLTWSPNRVCDIEYRGDFTFIVKSSQLTKLTEGTSFRCQVIEKGEQLFLDHVYFDEKQRSPLNYIAGKIGESIMRSYKSDLMYAIWSLLLIIS